MSSQCPTCQFQFGTVRSARQHRCLVTICGPGVVADLEVMEAEGSNRMLEAAKYNSTWQIFELCESTKKSIPGFYPLFFPPQGPNNYPLLPTIGSTERSYDLLRKAARDGPVKLRRSLNIGVNGRLITLDQSLLLPRNAFLLRGLEVNIFINITKNPRPMIHNSNCICPAF